MDGEPRSTRFRMQREATWKELEKILAAADRRGLAALPEKDLVRLPSLYRATLSALSVARDTSLDRNLIEYLEGLSARAYFAVYGTKRRLGSLVFGFFLHDFPRALRECRVHLLLATSFFFLGLFLAYHQTATDLESFYTFVDPAYASGRNPAASTESLRKTLYDTHPPESLALFASGLFSHNARIGMVSTALGFLAGVPVVLGLLMNGLLLGAFLALFADRGLFLECLAWLAPHGVTEILALLICAAAGFALAEGLLYPGRNTRARALLLKGRTAGILVVGAVALFFIAGLIEGFFRQLVLDVRVRGVVAISSAVLWTVYFTRSGRRRTT